jgi:tRNA pseudouridine55 synthase
MTNDRRDGFLLLNKKPGLTSFESLSAIKKIFSTGKVGHAGTLDKFAGGLLLLLVGRGVKLFSLFEKCSKEYTATVFFGAETDTLDPEGEIIAQGPVPSEAQLQAALDDFRGEIMQAPPAYSAIHIDGQRAHKLARQGKAVEMKKRQVTVHELELLSFTAPRAVIRAHVSAGTYIRSLARDIALAAGSRAHLGSLERTKLGPFNLEEAASFASAADGEFILKSLRPLDRALFDALSLPWFYMDEPAARGFVHGRPLKDLITAGALSLSTANTAGIFRDGQTKGDELLGFISRRNETWVYGHVFANS